MKPAVKEFTGEARAAEPARRGTVHTGSDQTTVKNKYGNRCTEDKGTEDKSTKDKNAEDKKHRRSERGR